MITTHICPVCLGKTDEYEVIRPGHCNNDGYRMDDYQLFLKHIDIAKFKKAIELQRKLADGIAGPEFIDSAKLWLSHAEEILEEFKTNLNANTSNEVGKLSQGSNT